MSSKPSRQSLKELQLQFARYIRDPNKQTVPDNVERRNMAVYHELFYNNIEGFVSTAFPVLRKLTADDVWHEMVKDFMARHRSKTPLFHKIAQEFLAYLDNERNVKADPVFINELAHYEWVELALSVSDAEVDGVNVSQTPDPLNEIYTLSPLARILMYQYPVHQISPDFQPQQPNEIPVFLLVYRNNEDRVSFLELNPVSACLIDLINEGKTGQEAAILIAKELPQSSLQAVIDGAQLIIKDWLVRGIIRRSIEVIQRT